MKAGSTGLMFIVTLIFLWRWWFVGIVSARGANYGSKAGATAARPAPPPVKKLARDTDSREMQVRGLVFSMNSLKNPSNGYWSTFWVVQRWWIIIDDNLAKQRQKRAWRFWSSASSFESVDKPAINVWQTGYEKVAKEGWGSKVEKRVF